MTDQSTLKTRLVTAAMRLAAEAPWRDVSLTQIAEAAGVSLIELRNTFSTKGEVVAAFVRMIDDEVLAQTQAASATRAAATEDTDSAPLSSPTTSAPPSPRDALFDVVMARFDALAPYKPALRSMAESWSVDPAVAAAVARSQSWMLRAAGIDADGIEGRLKAAGLAGIYASVYRTWLQDDDPGLGKTMAALDSRLRRGENTLQRADSAFGKLCGFARSCRAAVSRRTASRRSESKTQPDDTSPDDLADIPPGALS